MAHRRGGKAQLQLLQLGVEPDGRGSKAFAQFQTAEVEKWRKVVKAANIQIDR